MKKYISQNINLVIVLFGVLIYLFHFTERDPSSPYERPIISDAKGYYAYLPAVFIYQDLQYDFIEEMDQEYYAVGHDKHIFIEQNGRRVNKTFPGVALLYLPFFLIAHFLALILSLPADGYSDVYQYLFDFGQFFYATIGLVLMLKSLLKLGFDKRLSLIATFILLLGTNLWFYTIYDQSVTHVYNFFLINLLIYLSLTFKEAQKVKFFILVVAVLSLLIIIRPTNVMSLLLLAVVIPEKSFWKLVLSQFVKIKVILFSLIVGLSILSIPLLLWKIQSGNWIVYSYGEEGFDFAHPEIINFLFSYAKGWWLYSPLVLITLLLGGTFLFKSSPKGKVQSFILFVFLIMSVYVFSSWWCWWYGFSFGQRPMVDYYFVIGFLLVVILKKIEGERWKELAFGGVVLFAIFLNLLQSYQHHHGFFQWSKPNAEIYWDNFLRFEKSSRVYKEENWSLLRTQEFDFEKMNESIQGEVISFDKAFSGNKVIGNNENSSFSCNIILSDLNKLVSSHAVVSFKVMALSEMYETDLIIEYRGDESTYMNYNFNQYTKIEEWVSIEIKYDVVQSSDTLVLYFWNKDSGQKAYYDDVRLEFYGVD